MTHLETADPAVHALVQQEIARVNGTLNLIAAEHHPPACVLQALGSVFHAKAIEGYPGKRYHGGCVHADDMERLAVSRAKAVFGADHANVQPHSGTAANLAVLFACLDVGDRVLAMDLAHGGHLSHGHHASITSRCFSFAHYGLHPETDRIDYDDVARQAAEYRPKMIIAGASAYPRLIDYARMAEIADSVSALLFVDMAHIAGLVAAGAIPSPVPHADVVTFTCYKTMGGARGGVILSTDALARRIDSRVFPGCQGTSAVDLIAAKAVTFHLAATDAFSALQRRTLDNADALAGLLANAGFRVITGGTDTHQVLLDVTVKGMDGARAEDLLESAGLVTNRNTIPADREAPGHISGIRLGTGAISARGMGTGDMRQIAEWINAVISEPEDGGARERIRASVRALCDRFPVPE